MARKSMLGLGAMLLLLVIAAGCVLPIVQTAKTSLAYEFRADASMKYTQVIEGTPLADTLEWEGDCTEKYRSMLDSVTSMLMMATAAGMAQGQAPDENVQKITALLNNIKNNTVCHFTRISSEKGVLETSMAMSRENIGVMNDLMQALQQPGMQQGGTIKVENTPEGAIKFTLGNTTSGSTTPPSEIKVKVEGTLVSLEPAGYAEEGGYYKYSDPATQLAGKDLVVVYKPAGFDIFALIPGGMLGLVGIIIAVAAIAAIAFFAVKLRSGSGIGIKMPVPSLPKQAWQQKPAQQAVQQPRQQASGQPWLKQAPEQLQQPAGETSQKQAAAPSAPRPLTREEEVDAAKLTIRLSKIAEKFSREEIMQSITEGGYSSALAGEVARRLEK